jgi:hypothetical protein
VINLLASSHTSSLYPIRSDGVSKGFQYLIPERPVFGVNLNLCLNVIAKGPSGKKTDVILNRKNLRKKNKSIKCLGPDSNRGPSVC